MSTWLSFFINLHHYTGITPKSVRTEAKVDKNRSKCLNLFYHPPKKNMHKKAAAPTLRLLKIIYFSTQPPSIGTFAP